MCTYDDENICSMNAGFLGGRFLDRRYRMSFGYPGALCGSCVCQRCKQVIIVLHLYHVLASLTDDVCTDALWNFYLQ